MLPRNSPHVRLPLCPCLLCSGVVLRFTPSSSGCSLPAALLLLNFTSCCLPDLCSGVVLRVLFHPKQLMLVSAGDDAEVRVWDLVTRSCAAGEACTEKAELRWSAGGIASAGVGPGDPLLRTR